MSLYTIIDIDYIMNDSSIKEAAKNVNTTYQELLYKGVKLEGLYMDNTRFIVNRIISTNPKDYLIQEIQPGAEIELIPKIDNIK